MKKCQFKKVDTLKAFGLSFLFNYPNNITTIKLKQGYINKDLDKEYFSEDILQEMLNKGEGIISAGVYTLFGKTYLMADYIFFQNDNAENFNYRKDAVVKKCVFEISSSDEASELVEKKYSSQARLFDSYRANPISLIPLILFLIALLLRRKNGKVLAKNTKK